MAFTSLKVDQVAHDLVLKCCHEYPKGIKESYKMRMTVAYGLERFWGEQFRLKGDKARYWLETWKKLVEIMGDAGIEIPNDEVSSGEPAAIRDLAQRLWTFPQEQRKVALAILIQLCDSLVWWTQRYKNLIPEEQNDDDN